MKKLLLSAIFLIFSTSCFAGDVYIRTPTDDSIIDPRSVTLQAGTAVAGKVYITDGSDTVSTQDNRLKVYTAPNVMGAFKTAATASVATLSISRLDAGIGGYAYDLTIKAGANNKSVIYIGPSTMTTSNYTTVGYPLATSATVHFDIVNFSQIYMIAKSLDTDDNSISYICNWVTP